MTGTEPPPETRRFVRRAIEVTEEYDLDVVDVDAVFLGVLETDCRARSLIATFSPDLGRLVELCRNRLVRLRTFKVTASGRGPVRWREEAQSIAFNAAGDRPDSLEVLVRLLASDRFYHSGAARRFAADLADAGVSREKLSETVERLRREVAE